MMKRVLPILLCLLMAGCCTRRYEYFGGGFTRPAKGIVPYPRVEVSGGWYGVPLIAWTETRGAPYRLDIIFMSETVPEQSLVLKKVIIVNTKGERHELLSEDVLLDKYEKRRVYYTSASHGSYKGDVYEAKWSRKKIPLKFEKKSAVKINIEYSVDGVSHSKDWSLPSRLQKKTYNLKSYMDNIT